MYIILIRNHIFLESNTEKTPLLDSNPTDRHRLSQSSSEVMLLLKEKKKGKN